MIGGILFLAVLIGSVWVFCVFTFSMDNGERKSVSGGKNAASPPETRLTEVNDYIQIFIELAVLALILLYLFFMIGVPIIDAYRFIRYGNLTQLNDIIYLADHNWSAIRFLGSLPYSFGSCVLACLMVEGIVAYSAFKNPPVRPRASTMKVIRKEVVKLYRRSKKRIVDWRHKKGIPLSPVRIAEFRTEAKCQIMSAFKKDYPRDSAEVRDRQAEDILQGKVGKLILQSVDRTLSRVPNDMLLISFDLKDPRTGRIKSSVLEERSKRLNPKAWEERQKRAVSERRKFKRAVRILVVSAFAVGVGVGVTYLMLPGLRTLLFRTVRVAHTVTLIFVALSMFRRAQDWLSYRKIKEGCR